MPIEIQAAPTPPGVVAFQELDSREALWRQVLARDATASFVYAVRSTGIFCRPSCPSRRPAAKNVSFYRQAGDALAAGYRACKRCLPLGAPAEPELVLKLCRYLAQHRHRTVTLAELGQLAQASPFTVQRKFVRVLGLSPRQYQAQLRAGKLRLHLSGGGPAPGRNVTHAIYAAGYGSSSRFYERSAEVLGMDPTRFRDGGRGESIRYTVAPCSLGRILVAATGRGVCSVMLGENAAQLAAQLRRQFHAAQIVEDSSAVSGLLSQVLGLLDNRPSSLHLPLDLRATAFQARVWQVLRQIPRGQTRSYAEVAGEIGNAKAVRAVARACAANPVALVIPCHRVIGAAGSLTGYRWGVERKRDLLAMEKEADAEASGRAAPLLRDK